MKDRRDRSEMTDEEAARIRNDTERRFARLAIECGYEVHEGSAITSPVPIDRGSKKKPKVVTHPDFLVVDNQTGKTAHVEVGSECNSDHKREQQRVADLAGVQNYTQLNAHAIQAVEGIEPPQAKRNWLQRLLRWG